MKKDPRKRDFESVGDAIRQMFRSYNLTSRFDEATLISSWERLVGKPIARRTRKLVVRDKVLFVEFDSPTMRHDFSLHKSQVLEILKKEFGAGVVTEIVIM